MEARITKKYKKKAIVYTLLSWLTVFAIALGLVIYGLSTRWTGNGEMAEKFRLIISLIGTSLIACAVLSIIVKDKIKPLVWMVDIILSAYLFEDYIMYIVFFIWIIDTYIITNLAKYYRQKHSINKEIDKRF